MEADAVQALLPLADAFLRENEGGVHVELRASLHTGVYAKGMTRSMLEHIYMVLSSMRCWKTEELAEPWKTRVVYTVGIHSVESFPSSDHLPPEATATVTTGPHADGAELRVTHITHKKRLSTPPRETGALGIDLDLIRTIPGKRYLSAETEYRSVVVDTYKEFVFTSHYTWKYTLALRYEYPYAKEDDVIQEVQHPDLTFLDTPKYHVWVSCSSVERVRDPTYLVHSLLLKLGDLVPVPYREPQATSPDNAVRFHVVDEPVEVQPYEGRL